MIDDIEENNYNFIMAKEFVDKLTGDERIHLFNMYCSNCGDIDPSCQCGNDE